MMHTIVCGRSLKVKNQLGETAETAAVTILRFLQEVKL